MTRLVVPQTLRGFRDVLPDEMFARNDVTEKIRRVYESYGYQPIDTPTLELLPTLVGTGGEETDKLIFLLESPEKQRVGLRFDLTVPFARIVAQYTPNEIKLPFRRYHIGPVFRADDPQPDRGRFRQFTQFDIDIAGTDSIAADAEIVAAVCDVMRAVGLSETASPESRRIFQVRVNNRLLVDAFLDGIGVVDSEQAKRVMRVIDKREKLSQAQLLDELGGGRVDESGDPIAGVGLDRARIESVLEFVNTSGASRRDTVDELDKIVRPGPRKDPAFGEVSLMLEHLDALGVAEAAARLDPSLTRGLEYYTGAVFECTIPYAGVGSVMGGGRYDGLVSRFRDESIPATGASIGLDRLVTGLRNVGLGVSPAQARTGVIVLVMPGVPEPEASRVAAELRNGGVAAELYVGDAMGKVARQLAYANSRGMGIAVLLGEEEMKTGSVAIKDLREGDESRRNIVDNEGYRSAGSAGQQTVSRADLLPTVRGLLARALDRDGIGR
jgi:histidyl-tRNA synthetase